MMNTHTTALPPYSGLAFILTLLALVCVGTARADLATRRTPVVEAIQKVSPSVVNISTEQVVREQFNPFGSFHNDMFRDFEDFFGDFNDMFPSRESKRQTLGSGVIIDSGGYVLTNAHVIMQASKITVTLPDHREFEATVVGADPDIDLAILKIHVNNELPVAAIGSSESLMIGETVIAIGNPFGLEHTVTTGVISAKNRSIKGGDGRAYNNFLQTDASINPGNSGGPLVNLDGEVIGINTAIYTQAQGIGFAIPIDRATRAVKDLLAYGEVKRAWIGIQVQDLTETLARKFGFDGAYGVLVAEIIDNGPARDAGMEPGDIITEVNSLPVHNVQEFYDKASGLMAGEPANLKVFRDGHFIAVSVTAATLPTGSAEAISRQWLGVEVDSVDQTTIRTYNLATNDGVVITTVQANSLAARTGLRRGDVIHQLGSIEINTLDDFNKAVVLASERSSVLILIQRGRTLYYTNIGTNR